MLQGVRLNPSCRTQSGVRKTEGLSSNRQRLRDKETWQPQWIPLQGIHLIQRADECVSGRIRDDYRCCGQHRYSLPELGTILTLRGRLMVEDVIRVVREIGRVGDMYQRRRAVVLEG